MGKRLPAQPPVIPGYTSIRPLGAGGFADVFLFEQDRPKRSVAVKVLLRHAVDPQALRLFNAEADIMARLSAHPSILTVYEASISSDGRLYLVTEYCPTSLTSRYRSETMSIAEVLQIGVKISSAVETAHRADLLHRDIKPSNVLFTAYGAPVLADFGIAASLNSVMESVVAMSVPWSAPEVVAERTTGTVASEIWSLGATIYTLLAGHSPVQIPGANNSRDVMKSRSKRGKYLRIERGDVPESLQQVLATSMQVNPAHRYATALAFAQALQRVEYELGLPVTALEVVDASLAAAGPPINFENDELRGPQRSSVRAPSLRHRAQQRHDASTGRSPSGGGIDDGTVFGTVDRQRTPPWIWALVGALGGIVVVLSVVVLVGWLQQ